MSRVTGPTSALTSFLRDRGIRPPTQNRFQRIPVEEQLNPPTQSQEISPDQTASSSSNSNINQIPVPESAIASTSRFPKSSSKKKGKGKHDDGDEEGKPVKKARTSKKIIQLAHNGEKNSQLVRLCQQCNRRFIFESDDQQQCNACLNVGVIGKKSGSNAAQKRALKKAEKTVLEMTGELAGYILPLKELCIQAIVKNVDLVMDSVCGALAPETKRKLSRIISKQRKLDENVLPLFLGPKEDELELYDCSYLSEEILNQIPEECPELRVLNLGMCGKATDQTLEQIGNNLSYLTTLKLQGTYLCSSGAYAQLFQNLSQLRSLSLENATKLTNEAIQYLVRACPTLECLSLCDCPYIDDPALQYLKELESLNSLSLNAIGQLTDDSLISFVKNRGPHLISLSLNKQPQLSGKALTALKFCQSLQSLSIQNCPGFESQDIASILSFLQPLTSLDLSGNNNLKNEVLEHIANYHGSQLSFLGLNSLDLLDDFSSLSNLTKLRELDISWIRGIHDELLLDLFTNTAKQLEKIWIFGCTLLSRAFLERPWKNEKGKRIVILGNEFD